MTKVKIISENEIEKLESRINNFLDRYSVREVIDIKINTIVDTVRDRCCVYALIMYKER